MAKADSKSESHEIAVVGELDECQPDVVARLLELADGDECTLFIDSGGGRVYSALAIMSLIQLKGLRARAVVLGACSSAAIMVLAACRERFAVPFSVFQFHPVRWESGENVEKTEASEWAKHFTWLEEQCDELMARLLGVDLALIQQWCRSSRYLTGRELAESGVLRLIDPTQPGACAEVRSEVRPRKTARPAK
jgi:ATP-dependent Clp protease protease subunit